MEIKFFCVRVDQGTEFDTDNLVSDGQVQTVYVGDYNGYTYYGGEVLTAQSVQEDLPETEFYDKVVLPIRKVDRLAEVDAMEIALLLQIEGDDNVNYTRAMATAYADGRYDDIDRYYFQKRDVSTAADVDRGYINAVSSHASLEAYQINSEVNQSPSILFNCLTVGSFINRFTATENDAIQAYLATNSEIKRSYDALLARSHINVTFPEVKMILTFMADQEVFDNTPKDPANGSRIAELLAKGNTSEAYRPSLT